MRRAMTTERKLHLHVTLNNDLATSDIFLQHVKVSKSRFWLCIWSKISIRWKKYWKQPQNQHWLRYFLDMWKSSLLPLVVQNTFHNLIFSEWQTYTDQKKVSSAKSLPKNLSILKYSCLNNWVGSNWWNLFQ